MSILVDLTRLAATLQDFGSGFLVTTGEDGRAKVVTVDPEVEAGAIMLPPSKGSARNLAMHSAATLVFPPLQAKGYTLLVDGDAVPSGAVPSGAVPSGAVLSGAVPSGAVPSGAVPSGAVPSDDRIRFTPVSAVLHRPASHGDGPPPPAGAGEQSGCESDCRPA
ncbi:hypothetical protein ASG90_18990 [Nocardioides sp. Soil797]|nr:hypothetical protein ASG90_18990 [Nocardioides sp. Soil797]